MGWGRLVRAGESQPSGRRASAVNSETIYDVFISYRTSRSPDREIAEALQSVLETYRVPASLRHHLVRPLPTAGAGSASGVDLWRAIFVRLTL